MQNHGMENRGYIQLPEGVDIALTPSGLLARSYAYMIDFGIRITIFLVCLLVLEFMGKTGDGLQLILYFLLSWGYNIYFEAKTGQTPGKKRIGLRVVQENGLPSSFSQIVVRNLLRPADMLPFAYFLGLMVMLFNRNFKRIGDWAAGTLVVHEQAIVNRHTIKAGDVDVPNIVLTTQEQQAILSFAERADEFSSSRRKELASILAAPLAESEQHIEQKLFNIARYVAGHNSNYATAESSNQHTENKQ